MHKNPFYLTKMQKPLSWQITTHSVTTLDLKCMVAQ